MSDDPLHHRDDRQDVDWATLSSMADGEAGHDAQERCLLLWADHAEARERWRHYQLIGDVLRSGELAREAAHDAAFLSALRARLAQEPPVLRPAVATSSRRVRLWATPIAAAAGVAAVAGVVVMLRSPLESAQPMVASRTGVQPVVASAPSAEPQLQQPVNGRLIRDARLERYFAAHRQSGSGAALQMPGGVVRSVDTIVLEDR
jgi:sigma-E factor negative regulatory protein RseA